MPLFQAAIGCFEKFEVKGEFFDLLFTRFLQSFIGLQRPQEFQKFMHAVEFAYLFLKKTLGFLDAFFVTGLWRKLEQGLRLSDEKHDRQHALRREQRGGLGIARFYVRHR